MAIFCTLLHSENMSFEVLRLLGQKSDDLPHTLRSCNVSGSTKNTTEIVGEECASEYGVLWRVMV